MSEQPQQPIDPKEPEGWTVVYLEDYIMKERYFAALTEAVSFYLGHTTVAENSVNGQPQLTLPLLFKGKHYALGVLDAQFAAMCQPGSDPIDRVSLKLLDREVALALFNKYLNA